MIQVLTHRGLDPSKRGYFAESSREAFEDQLLRGYGLEFDVRPDLTICHGDPERIKSAGGTVIALPQMVEMILTMQRPGQVSALHLKRPSQEKGVLDAILSALKGRDLSKFFIFDVTPGSAAYMKGKMPALMLAPSVAHRYDIGRYNGAVGGTLLSLDEALSHKNIFDWAWLDEWDTLGARGGKKFYTPEVFAALRAARLKIALVTPELHATSPGLLGGESHADARDHTALIARIKEIVGLGPDLICTDYPDEVRAIIDNFQTTAG